MSEFIFIISKLMELKGFQSKKKLRRHILASGIRANTFDGWKRREKISANGVLRLAEIFGVRAEDLINRDGLNLERPKSSNPVLGEDIGEQKEEGGNMQDTLEIFGWVVNVLQTSLGPGFVASLKGLNVEATKELKEKRDRRRPRTGTEGG
jgi:hypothetical protein